MRETWTGRNSGTRESSNVSDRADKGPAGIGKGKGILGRLGSWARAKDDNDRGFSLEGIMVSHALGIALVVLFGGITAYAVRSIFGKTVDNVRDVSVGGEQIAKPGMYYWFGSLACLVLAGVGVFSSGGPKDRYFAYSIVISGVLGILSLTYLLALLREKVVLSEERFEHRKITHSKAYYISQLQRIERRGDNYLFAFNGGLDKVPASFIGIGAIAERLSATLASRNPER